MTLTTEMMHEIYEAAVHSEASGSESAEFELLCKLESVGGTSATIRKLIDMVRAANREWNVTPVYTAPPAPAVVKLPTEFYSDEGIVVRLEEVMAALAVVGVQYERKTNAKTRCGFPSSEVPEEMTGGIAMNKYKVKKSNYAQWVKGWNACRAAMLAQPVSSGYTLPPHVYRELVNSLRDTAVKFSGTEQLRERLNTALSQFIEPDHPHTRTVAPEGGNDHDTRR